MVHSHNTFLLQMKQSEHKVIVHFQQNVTLLFGVCVVYKLKTNLRTSSSS